MPGPGSELGQGQTVALLMAAAGVVLLVLVLALETPARPGRALTRARSVLVGSLLLTAGVALLLVRRLDPAALTRVLAGATAVLLAAAVAEQQWRCAPVIGQDGGRHGQQVRATGASGSTRNG